MDLREFANSSSIFQIYIDQNRNDFDALKKQYQNQSQDTQRLEEANQLRSSSIENFLDRRQKQANINKILNSYIYFGVFCAVILLPLLLITHYFLTKLDFHISIVSAVMVTACVFIGYDIFKVYTRKIISKKIIQKAWALHFPYFAYEKYSTMAGEFYKEALKEEIPKANLEQYVLDKIIHSK
ncbi:hypothetical protein GAB47_05800 [Campylobacter jejuni]|nr:hypothetical protein [Campylobacter jejuni]EAK6844259.1 hypothetical protein [Campylobacter jejuni]EAL4220071.1 hypothetical protein [Campylobacter jejuni]EAL5193391.1 hypothetical protein [Campylobacter jejuni]EAL9399192.1 hypothetical protein [Campylobacter jejuni]